MLEKIINGISNQLFNVFGADYKIYADNKVQQGLKNPCFFISVLNPSHKNYINGRFFRSYPFMVQYFPKDENDNFELYSVGEKLIEGLEYITLENEDLLKGINLKYEIVDNIVNFQITFNLFMQKQIEKNNMDNIQIKI